MEQMRRKSELKSELEEKKPVDFGTIDYNNKTDVKNLGKIRKIKIKVMKT